MASATPPDSAGVGPSVTVPSVTVSIPKGLDRSHSGPAPRSPRQTDDFTRSLTSNETANPPSAQVRDTQNRARLRLGRIDEYLGGRAADDPFHQLRWRRRGRGHVWILRPSRSTGHHVGQPKNLVRRWVT
jgi:hypothetical protein